MPNSTEHSIYVFDDFRLDRARLMLYRGETELNLPPKAVETLAELVAGGGEIVSKDDLIDAVWTDSVVEESNLSQYLYLLRKALGTRPDGKPYIETLRRRGYRFTAEARSISQTPAKGRTNRASHERRTVERRGNVLAPVDWQEPEPQLEPILPPQRHEPSSKPKKIPYLPAFLSIGVLIAIGIGGLWYFWPGSVPVVAGVERPSEKTVTVLTNGNFVFGATISPDGKYFSYAEVDSERSRLYVQQTGQNSRVELASMQGTVISGTTFTPDGRSIYFTGLQKGEKPMSVFRIPTIGGTPPTKVLSGAGISSVTFSPDGKEMAFTRFNALDDTAVVVADKDGRTERVVVSRRGIVAIGSNSAWSPDGTKVAFTEMTRTGSGVSGRLMTVDIATGTVSPISDELWDMATRIEWVADGSGIVTVATRATDRQNPVYHYAVYHISYSDGVSRRLSNDGNRHELNSVGVAKDGALIVVPSTRTCQIWSMSGNGDKSSKYQVTRGSADGRAGLAFLPEGRIAYTARTAESLSIWIANADGSEAKQLETGFNLNEELRADPAGRFLVFSSLQDATHHLFRIDTDGTNLKQLTFGPTSEIDATISPDGKTIVTHSEDASTNPPKTVLKKVPTEGGEPQLLPVENCMSPVFSPDGSMLSCIRNGTEAVIVRADDGIELESLNLPPGSDANFGALWKPDSTGLIVTTHEKGVNSNLTVIPRDRRKPYKLTNFSDGTIYRFALSHDGGRLLFARGYPTQDAVLMRNAF